MNKKINNFWSCRATGLSHLSTGIGIQDFCCGRHFSWGDIIVLADGVGSCPNSAAGSQNACRAAVLAADHYLRKGIVDYEKISSLLHKLWLESLEESADTACTTCRTAFLFGGYIHTLSLGDGMTALCGTTPETTVILQDEKHFVNETSALSSVFSFQEWQCGASPQKDFCGVLLCTDGVSERYKKKTRPLFACAVMENLAPLERRKRYAQLKKLLKKITAEHDDDKTIIGISWK